MIYAAFWFFDASLCDTAAVRVLFCLIFGCYLLVTVFSIASTPSIAGKQQMP
uniref:Uncharacterized protein n=1 Tax=Arundo donax TaxID=35708 RepID=A0A0A9F7M5_ARUDO